MNHEEETNRDVEQTDTLIVGAGPAGLAVAACLKQANIPYKIVEKTQTVGNTWRNHYKRLHFHTAKKYSKLPYKKFDKEFARFPSRQQVVRYLEDYAKDFDINPIFNETISNIEQKKDGKWLLTGKDLDYAANNVVIATGYCNRGKMAKFDGLESFTGKVMHSSEYQTGLEFEGKNVLVIGFGNSAVEIALDLYECGAKSALSVRSPVNVLPREVLGMPTLAMGIWQRYLPVKIIDAINKFTSRLLIGDLRPYGLRPLERGPMEDLKNNRRVPMLDIGTIGRIKAGQIKVYQGIDHIDKEQITFTDGSLVKFDAIIMATGYSQNVEEFLTLEETAKNNLIDRSGCPTISGKPTQLDGLYFCGYDVSPAGMFREMGLEAKKIAKHISLKNSAANRGNLKK